MMCTRLDELAGQVHELRSQTPALDTDAIQQRIDELAALLGGDAQSVEVLQRLAAQHNQQRSAQSVADERYEIRWQAQTPATATADAGSTWLLVGDADALAAFRTELLPEGVWLTTCAELPGLVVETDTREEGERLATKVAAELLASEKDYGI